MNSKYRGQHLEGKVDIGEKKDRIVIESSNGDGEETKLRALREKYGFSKILIVLKL